MAEGVNDTSPTGTVPSARTVKETVTDRFESTRRARLSGSVMEGFAGYRSLRGVPSKSSPVTEETVPVSEGVPFEPAADAVPPETPEAVPEEIPAALPDADAVISPSTACVSDEAAEGAADEGLPETELPVVFAPDGAASTDAATPSNSDRLVPPFGADWATGDAV